MNELKNRVITKPIGIIAATSAVVMLILRVWEIVRDHEGNPFYLPIQLLELWDEITFDYDFVEKMLIVVHDSSKTMLIVFCIFALVALFLNRKILVLISSFFFTILPLCYTAWNVKSYLNGDSALEETLQSLPIVSAFTQELFYDDELMIWKLQYNLGLIVFGLLLTAALMMNVKNAPGRVVAPSASPRPSCPNCNAAVDVDSKFCSTCGKPFVT